MSEKHQYEPLSIEPVFNGWIASAENWAVHGETREKALEEFQKWAKRRKELETVQYNETNINLLENNYE